MGFVVSGAPAASRRRGARDARADRRRSDLAVAGRLGNLSAAPGIRARDMLRSAAIQRARRPPPSASLSSPSSVVAVVAIFREPPIANARAQRVRLLDRGGVAVSAARQVHEGVGEGDLAGGTGVAAVAAARGVIDGGYASQQHRRDALAVERVRNLRRGAQTAPMIRTAPRRRRR